MILNEMNSLAFWALATGLSYIALMGLMIGVILPVSKPNPIAEQYFELIAASRKKWLYRLTIVVDMLTWVALYGFLIKFGMLIKNQQVIFLTIGLVIGFFGAALRLSATPAIAEDYLTAKDQETKTSLIRLYALILRLINVSFSVGGIIGGVSLMLIGTTALSGAVFSNWIIILFGLAGIIFFLKGLLELVLNKDLGPMQLFGNLLLLIPLFYIVIHFL
jgi:hypothetical protein